MGAIKCFNVMGKDKRYHMTDSYGRFSNRRDAANRLNECSNALGGIIKFWIDEKIIDSEGNTKITEEEER